MKMKEFGPGGVRVPGAPPLDPPMICSDINNDINDLDFKIL